MIVAALLVGIGAALLAYSGDRLVGLAVNIAEKARLTPAVIGLTIVAAGTSAPELFVSITAALGGTPGIAIGNVVGSNIANFGLILGSCALVTAVPVAAGVLRFEYPFLVLSTWIALLLCRDGWLDRLEGGFFIAAMVAFTAYAVWVAQREIGAAEQELVSAASHASGAGPRRQAAWLLAVGVLAALAGLVLGAHLLVKGAVALAQGLGVSERIVGLTVVAVGTSLPELAVSVAAALRKQLEMAVANVVGSNVFNLLMILGAAGLARPLPIDARTIKVDMWVMMGMTVLLFPLVFHKRTLSRRGGACLLLAYVGYLAWLATHAH